MLPTLRPNKPPPSPATHKHAGDAPLPIPTCSHRQYAPELAAALAASGLVEQLSRLMLVLLPYTRAGDSGAQQQQQQLEAAALDGLWIPVAVRAALSCSDK